MSGVWKYRYHDFFVNETRTTNMLIVGMGEYPFYQVIMGEWVGDGYENIEVLVKEETLDKWEKVVVE